MYNWSLNINNFTNQDRLSISEFITDPDNKWTQDKQVKKFEQEFASFVGSKYSVFVSSGSTANTILAQYTKDTTNKRKVILPSTTWQTSCSPWIREGFEPIFIDVDMKDFCIDKDMLSRYLEKFHNDVACVFPTSLIGFSPDMHEFMNISKKYDVKIMFDNCENTLGKYDNRNVSSYFTSTTSTYFGHQIQSVEGGFIFTNCDIEYEYFLMLRNHGMTRSLSVYSIDSVKYRNIEVDGSFDFYCLGSNYRNTDINAFIGSIDLKRASQYAEKRKKLYEIFQQNLNRDLFYLPETRNKCEDVPFCLPIIVQYEKLIHKAKKICEELKIENRPIISGFLGYQTCYKNYFSLPNIYYNNSIMLHHKGFYVGLHHGLTEQDILYLCSKLNSID